MIVRATDKSNIDHMISIGLQLQVISRLPVKSLMRFKSVCTEWFSHITHPSFVALYQSRREGLLVIPPCNRSSHPHGWDRRFYTIDCKKNPKHRCTVLEDSSLPFTTNRVTNIVNGLVCFYHRDGNESSVSIYNLTTRENLHLPAPTCLSNFCRKCRLGFDPINKVYKLLHTYWKGKDVSEIEVGCEVLTIKGKDEMWKTIDVSYIDIIKSLEYCENVGFCHDGVIYWRGNGIFAFHVEREKFEHISYPWETKNSLPCYICQVGGYLSLVVTPETRYHFERGPYTVQIIVTMWKLLGRDQDDGKPLWSEVVITCPFENHVLGDVKCTDFGLVTLVTLNPKSGLVVVNCYDLKCGKHKVLKVNNAQGFLRTVCGFTIRFMPTLMAENIMPLTSKEPGFLK